MLNRCCFFHSQTTFVSAYGQINYINQTQSLSTNATGFSTPGVKFRKKQYSSPDVD